MKARLLMFKIGLLLVASGVTFGRIHFRLREMTRAAWFDLWDVVGQRRFSAIVSESAGLDVKWYEDEFGMTWVGDDSYSGDGITEYLILPPGTKTRGQP